LGIEYDVNGLKLCAFKEIDDLPHLALNYSIPIKEWQSELKVFVEEHGLENTKVTVALATKKYQLLQTDKPVVPDGEIAQALQWSVKDLLMTQDEVAIDYFDIPAQTLNANKVNVVAVPKQELYDLSQGLMEAGLQIDSITIEELATCELLPDTQDAYVTMFQSPGNEVSLNIVKEGNIYFSRRIRGYEQISSFTEMELQMGVAETISVELQRSMDFFESLLKQAPVKKIFVKMDTKYQEALAKLIQEAMLVDAAPFIPPVLKTDDIDIEACSLPAIGAAFSILGKQKVADDEAQAQADKEAAA
jgi:MSHA biogenesis protein MshI